MVPIDDITDECVEQDNESCSESRQEEERLLLVWILLGSKATREAYNVQQCKSSESHGRVQV